MLVNLLSLTVLAKKSAQNSHAAHPQHLLGHTGITSTFSLTRTHVPSLALSQELLPASSSGVHLRGLLDEITILDKLTNGLTCTCVKGRNRL